MTIVELPTPTGRLITSTSSTSSTSTSGRVMAALDADRPGIVDVGKSF
jgi:hypothetical protein